MKKQLIEGPLTWLGSRVGHWLLLALGATWRVRQVGDYHARTHPGSSCVLAFSHGLLLPLVYLHRQRGHAAVISESRDGQIITDVVHRLGYEAVRGSTTRGGARALAGMIRALREGTTVGVTPDGPRGPRGSVQPGLVHAAARAGVPVVSLGIGTDRGWRARSWDRFLIPKPFARVVLTYSEPRSCRWGSDDAENQAMIATIERDLREEEERAQSLVAEESSS